jgi:uncharacterized membrane protein YcaP (DUF421 family)
MEIVVRASIIYFLLLILVRAMGRRQLSEMSAFELLVLVTMGDLVQQGVTQEDMSITGAFLSVSTFAVWSIAIGFITYRFRKTEDVLSGFPVMIVKDGKIIDEVLAIERVPLEEVQEAAREQGIEDLRHVRVGILEADGKFTFLRTDDKPPRSRQQRKKSE